MHCGQLTSNMLYTARQLICTFPDHSKYTPFTTSGIICDGSEKTSFSVPTLSSSSPKKNKKTPFFLHFNMYSLRRRVWDLRKREATYQIVSCCFFFSSSSPLSYCIAPIFAPMAAQRKRLQTHSCDWGH
ncbi:hypothetical protein H105_07805 [Trichophyton soudanense CBS 452.61]|uniref:Uncharacterized protein n=1 Tax=Trichophyton soudanense CBS 452.61 TaxID=1215331 RepID=A0A022XGL9_TRISD|nr:hypothetical protein H105_07805 [Trichophyton soudanense CBS 452.61]EZG02046.1 hypothetical protein H106_07639 [Trichophyton rubrum CBS 735.88]